MTAFVGHILIWCGAIIAYVGDSSTGNIGIILAIQGAAYIIAYHIERTAE